MRRFFLAFCIAALASGPVHATVVGGALTGGSAFNNGGVFEELDGNNFFSVGNNIQQSNNLFAFNEDQNIAIGQTINVDVGTAPQNGDTVASHYVFFDPGPSRRAVGYVDFDADIFGVATSRPNLVASDFLANTNVTYLSPALRGLENVDSVSVLVAEPRRLYIDFTASSPGDYVRVFTRRSPLAAVPLPAGAPLLLGALCVMAALRRRRRG